MRRFAPPHVLLAGYCAGLCLALVWRPSAWALVTVLVASAVGLVSLAAGLRRAQVPGRRSRRRDLITATLLGVLLTTTGLSVGSARLDAIGASRLADRVGEIVPIRATLVDLPTQREDTLDLAVKITQIDGVAVDEPAHLGLRLEDKDTLAVDHCGPLTEGALLTVEGVRVKDLPAPPQGGGFDYGRYLERRGEHVVLAAALDDLRVVGRRSGVQGLVDRLRLASRAHLRTGLRSPVADVLQGMVLGDDEGVPEAIVDDFRRSGLLHIMAVSGENVVLLCAMWSFAFMLFGIPRLARTLALLPVVACYVLLTGASPSIVRAGIAGIAGLLAILASRPTDGWLVWLVPGAWLLTANPNNLYDVSFQLSFAAVAGLLLLSRPLTHALRFLPGPLAEQAGVTTAASIATTPVSVLTFGSTSIVAVAANLAGGFVLGPIMFLGMLSLLAGFVASWLSLPLNVVAGLFIGFLLEVARFFGRLSFAVYEWQGPTLGLLLASAAAAEFIALRGFARREGLTVAGYLTPGPRRRTLAVVTASLLATVLVLAPVAPAAPAVPTLRFLSVGEGAATLLIVPDGPTVLIDAGPEPLGLRLRRLGVRRIDLVVVSHAHADHVAGLGDVAARLTVGAALIPGPEEPTPGLLALARSLDDAGVPVSTCRSPLSLEGEGWRLTVLPTRPPPGESGNQGENDAALVALVELGGRRLLVSGDAEGDVLEALDLPPCDVVELPHHGSRGGMDGELLGALCPALAVISVGPNKFGHPTPEMLALLAERGVPCLRTDQAGDVVVSAGEGGLAITTEAR